MKKVIQHFGADLDWVDSYAKQFGGKVTGNSIIVPDEIHTGEKYYLSCGEGIVAFYVDVKYHIDLCLIQKNLKDDFIALFYNLSKSENELTCGGNSDPIGSWSYNLSLIDSSSDFQFDIRKGSEVFVFCIFIKKEQLLLFSQKNKLYSERIHKILYPAEKNLTEWDRMSNECFRVLDDLRKQKKGDILFDLSMIGTVNILLSDYLSKIDKNETIRKQFNESDLFNIIQSQRFLIQNLENRFPGIEYLASEVGMSETKFKNFFRKITGYTPYTFFLNNKLFRAKELLETKELTVEEISWKLNFSTSSVFSSKFKKQFGILPKTYSLQL
ncbi:helix-turn-helix domain-containing protein [Flavobacterium daemonense]|uniref:helix-turn-helix domain-containing protein n=1 Tax=Flavobacterium daemonense TaxID=1393049 RepID=UPI0011861D8F|nr:AraC family transcriptional regulator [Flavobacterium daemonense]KAF2325785.1 helix-turn-helix transcriptional regulator [Flavobacterium daemonense]